MLKTARKSVLGGGKKGVLFLPQKTIAEALAPAKTYLEGVGAKIYTGETVSKIHIADGKISGISTNKCDFAACGFFVSALPVPALGKLLPDSSALKKRLGKIAQTDIANFYFSSPQKLLDGQYACLIGSPLHWIFGKGTTADGKNIYGITISASSLGASKAEAAETLHRELGKFFGNVEISDVLPSTFFGATISADTDTETARPSDAQARELPNMRICGDWVQTDLPCTMESAAKSATDFSI